MVEPIMYFAIGFLCASLLGLVLLPFVHNRAVRLTVKRLEAATPLSMAEIQADKDQLRAEFAMSTRRLELNLEQLKARATSQLAELGKKTEAMHRFRAELDEKKAAIAALEAREQALREQLRSTEAEVAAKIKALDEGTRTLSEREADIQRLTADAGEHSVLADSQRVEIVALRAQVEALKTQVDAFERDVQDAQERLLREHSAAEAAANQLNEESGKVENLERQLSARTAEAEMHRMLDERDDEVVLLRSEKALADSELVRTREECARLQREIAALRRAADGGGKAEQEDDSLLHARLEEFAAEVARLTALLEGAGSPIETILARDGAPSGATHPEDRNLADRIRALQARAARVPGPG